MKWKKTIQMCKLILIRSFMYTDNSPWFGFFRFFVEKRTTCRKCMWKEENHHRFSFCCDLWMLAYVCSGMYMCKCVCWWAVNLDLKRICVVDVSWATLPTAGLPYLQRAGSLWDLSPDRSYTLYSNALAHISNRKMKKKLFPIIRALDLPFTVHMEAICTHFHPLYPVCICIYGWLCWCGEFCVWIGFRLNTDLHIYSNRTRVYKWRTNRKITPYTISSYTK